MNKSRTTMEERIRELVERIVPYDQQEQADVVDVMGWISSGAELFRRQRPDVPDKHLVSYLVLVDGDRRSLLLMDHAKSGLWLPAGGHVEPGENPHDTATRELVEELGLKAAQVSTVADVPFFITVTETRGTGCHTDVSLWYLVAADERMWLDVDPREFNGHRWQSFDVVLATDQNELDPHMHRFVRKLKSRM